MSIRRFRYLCSGLAITLLLCLPLALAETSKERSPIVVCIAALDSRPDRPVGPKLVIVLCNTGSTAVFIRRQLDRIEPWPWNPLQAKVVEVRSSKPAPTRVVVKPSERPLKERDFIELRPHYCYGVTVDLREYFLLEPGREYSVQFSYSSKAPTRVGKLVPWPGMVQSTKIIVKVH